MMKYPISQPYLTDGELENVSAAVKSTWISSSGTYLRAFEVRYARMCNRRYAVATSSGTAALHLALATLGIGEHDEVIVPSFTYIASVNVITQLGANPVFVEIDPDSLCLAPDSVSAAVTPKTRAIMAVDLYGHCVDMEAIEAIARQHDLFIIEDAAEAQGSRYKDRIAGSFGHISCFSLYGNKIITTGEGGICLTDDKDLYELLNSLANQGRSDTERYVHMHRGYNYCMTNVQAAIGCAQLDKFDETLAKRAQIKAWYTTCLTPLLEKGFLTFQIQKKNCKLNTWMFSIFLDSQFNRDRVCLILDTLGVDTRPFFPPVHKQPCYKEFEGLSFPISQTMARSGLNLPTYHQLTQTDIMEICTILEKVLTAESAA